jgi:hypothetical protein
MSWRSSKPAGGPLWGDRLSPRLQRRCHAPHSVDQRTCSDRRPVGVGGRVDRVRELEHQLPADWPIGAAEGDRKHRGLRDALRGCRGNRTVRTFAPGYFTASECAALLPRVMRLKVLGTAGYGTGGVIDVTDAQFGRRGGTFVVEVGAGNKWTISDGYGVGHPTVGTTAKDTSGFLTDLNGTIAAIRGKDCAAFVKYAFTATNGPSACTQPFASAIAKALTADPTAVPTSLGGNADFQFYSLTLKGYPGHPGLTYLTWDVGKTPPGPGVTYPYVADPPRRVG